ncbi:hypothetical protein AB4305_02350 [Nocardia sp. 2YAB30]|uniref:hypothetical protein n=1 Tax=unclassified Nocardia TaxID=2637762 RepID=UPI003F99B915
MNLAVAYVERLTKLGAHGVADAVRAQVGKRCHEGAHAGLVVVTGMVNLCNRIGVLPRIRPGVDRAPRGRPVIGPAADLSVVSARMGA